MIAYLQEVARYRSAAARIAELQARARDDADVELWEAELAAEPTEEAN